MSDKSQISYTFQNASNKEERELGATFAPKFLADGTIPAITVDALSGDVLMFAYMNAESLALSIETATAHYWSRSRNKLWRKGESSGNLQKIKEIAVDCDQDVILIKVEVAGHGASCHNGYTSCFYRAIDTLGQPLEKAKLSFTDQNPLFNPKDVYE